jgi:GNAT superfamily N-acetyltransferase
MNEDFHIRPAIHEDEAQWRVLWHGYNLFYEAPDVTEEVTGATWRRILDPHSAIGCIVAEENGRLLGFINYVIHPRTWSENDCCYMEDLYVDVAGRGKGVARALCTALKTLCMEKGLSRIYWNTREGNHTARALYDQIGVKDDFVRYVMPLAKS